MTPEQRNNIEQAAQLMPEKLGWHNDDNAESNDIKKSFIAGAEYALSQGFGGWVKAKQEPPVNEKYSESEYLLCLLDTTEQVVCWYKGKEKAWHVANFKADSLPITNITHWRQLPELPKKDETPSDKDKEIERLRGLIKDFIIEQDIMLTENILLVNTETYKKASEALNTKEVKGGA